MKYTLEIKITVENKSINTEEELVEIAESFLNDTIGDGFVKITDENGKVVEVKK